MKSYTWAVAGVLLGLIIGLFSANAIMQQNTQSSSPKLKSDIKSLGDQLNMTQTELNTTQALDANLRQENINLVQENAQLRQINLNLQAKITALQNNNTVLMSENMNLTSEMKQVKSAQLATRLGVRDCDWDYNDTRLYIAGEVWNVGTNTADNCSLHVTLYSGNFTEIDTYVELGSIPGGTYRDIAENIHYSGFTLTNWAIIPECNA